MKLKKGIEIDSECMNITVSDFCTVTKSIIINFNAILTPPFVINQKVTKNERNKSNNAYYKTVKSKIGYNYVQLNELCCFPGRHECLKAL